MNLAFMTHWGKDMPPHMAGKPTYFPEKVLLSLIWNYPHYDWESFEKEIDSKPQTYSCSHGDYNMKRHTVRTDEKDRWKAGNYIHFFINARTKDMFQFAPVIKCVSTQKIEITYDDVICDANGIEPSIIVDNKPLSLTEMEQLAINDGFDSLDDFLTYFNKDFKGKIIHWTNLKY